MNERNANLKKEVWSHFENIQLVFFATCDKNQPRIRPITFMHFNDKFWVSTETNSAKIEQIKNNKNIEFCLMFKEGEDNGYVRGVGEANIVQDKDTKKLLSEKIPFFKDCWKDADDPNYTLLEIVIKEIKYMKPRAFNEERFTL